ncbi:hypothetical protein FOA52_012411 [Chlamydomonas sp. UWO 241]|nr:hypothetical protein FOA52_012411 [Chlamydomonas sp. UWO 241]
MPLNVVVPATTPDPEDLAPGWTAEHTELQLTLVVTPIECTNTSGVVYELAVAPAGHGPDSAAAIVCTLTRNATNSSSGATNTDCSAMCMWSVVAGLKATFVLQGDGEGLGGDLANAVLEVADSNGTWGGGLSNVEAYAQHVCNTEYDADATLASVRQFMHIMVHQFSVRRSNTSHEEFTAATVDKPQVSDAPVNTSFVYNSETNVRAVAPSAVAAAGARRLSAVPAHLLETASGGVAAAGGSRMMLPELQRARLMRRLMQDGSSELGSGGAEEFDIVTSTSYMVPTDDAFRVFDGSVPNVYSVTAETSLLAHVNVADPESPVVLSDADAAPVTAAGPGIRAARAASQPAYVQPRSAVLTDRVWQMVTELPMSAQDGSIEQVMRTSLTMRLQWVSAGAHVSDRARLLAAVAGSSDGNNSASDSTSPAVDLDQLMTQVRSLALGDIMNEAQAAVAHRSARRAYPGGSYSDLLAELSARNPDVGQVPKSEIDDTVGPRRRLVASDSRSCTTQDAGSGKTISEDGNSLGASLAASSSSDLSWDSSSGDSTLHGVVNYGGSGRFFGADIRDLLNINVEFDLVSHNQGSGKRSLQAGPTVSRTFATKARAKVYLVNDLVNTVNAAMLDASDTGGSCQYSSSRKALGRGVKSFGFQGTVVTATFGLFPLGTARASLAVSAGIEPMYSWCSNGGVSYVGAGLFASGAFSAIGTLTALAVFKIRGDIELVRLSGEFTKLWAVNSMYPSPEPSCNYWGITVTGLALKIETRVFWFSWKTWWEFPGFTLMQLGGGFSCTGSGGNGRRLHSLSCSGSAIPCSVGSWIDNGVCKSCKPCSFGFTSAGCATTNAVADYVCNCPTGSWIDNGVCKACKPCGFGFTPAGCATTNAKADNVCACSIGSWIDDGVCKACKSCGFGFTSAGCDTTNARANNVCTCPIGKFIKDGTCNTCTPCGPGSAQTGCNTINANAGFVCTASATTCTVGNAACTPAKPSCDVTDSKNPVCVCPVGWYLNGNACTVCKTCGEGFKTTSKCTTNNAVADNVCTCPIGRYLDADACTECKACGEGFNTTTKCTTTNAAADNVCTCPIGWYLSGGTCTKCKTCTEGFSTTTKCTTTNAATDNVCTCPIGRYLSGGACTECKTCTDGFIANTKCTTTNAAADNVCTCPIGRYLSGGAWYQTREACTECSTCTKGFEATLQCTTTNAAADNVCTCPIGSYLNGNACTKCTSCGEGFTPAGCDTIDADADYVCTCPTGSYLNGNGCTECTPCREGFTPAGCDTTDAVANYVCVAVNCPTAPCSADKPFCDVSGDTDTCVCPAGMFIKDGTCSYCTLCKPDFKATTECTTTNAKANIVCTCPIGSYLNGDACTKCTACSKGFTPAGCDTTDADANYVCTCPTGSYLNGDTCTECTACGKGFTPAGCDTTDADANYVCTCPTGSYLNGDACTKCTPCGEGFTAAGCDTIDADANYVCTCPTGNFINAAGVAATCDVCTVCGSE